LVLLWHVVGVQSGHPWLSLRYRRDNVFQKHPAFDPTLIRRESLCRFGPHVKTLNQWVGTQKSLSHIQNIPLLPAVDATTEEGKWCQAQRKRRASYTGKHPTLASQRVPLGKTPWDTPSPTEEGHHQPLVLAGQRFPLSAPGFTAGSKLLQSPCKGAKQLYQACGICSFAGIS